MIFREPSSQQILSSIERPSQHCLDLEHGSKSYTHEEMDQEFEVLAKACHADTQLLDSYLTAGSLRLGPAAKAPAHISDSPT